MGAAKEAPSGAQGTTFALLAKAGTPLLSLAIFFLLFLFALRKESQLLSLSPAAAQAPVGALAAAAAAPPAQLCPCSQALVLDYFEIGTSNFDTLLQAAAASMKAGGPPKRGVSVDAIKVYISGLPEVPGLARVHSAVVGWEPHNDSVVTWFVDPQDLIDTWNGGTHVPPWLRGCNTVGRPFQTVIDELSKLNLMHLYRSQHVPALSVREVLLAHEGCRTRLLKIDTEGFDTILLVGYADFLWAHPECHADKVQFETMHSTAAQVAGAQAALEPAGYTQCGFEEDVGGGAPDMILCYSAHRDARLQWAARARGGRRHAEAEIAGLLSGRPDAVAAALDAALGELQAAARARPCGTCPWKA